MQKNWTRDSVLFSSFSWSVLHSHSPCLVFILSHCEKTGLSERFVEEGKLPEEGHVHQELQWSQCPLQVSKRFPEVLGARAHGNTKAIERKLPWNEGKADG